MRSAISSATLDQPAYLSAWTMLEAGSTGIQQYDLTARTNGGSSSHHLHRLAANGCPQRPHCGDGSRTTRDQQRLHTTPVSMRERSCSHETQARGSSRSTTPASAARTHSRVRVSARATLAASPLDPARLRTTAGTTVPPAPAASAAHPLPGFLSPAPLSPKGCLHACTRGP